MSKKLLIIAAFATAAMLSACSNAVDSQEITVTQESETESVTATEVPQTQKITTTTTTVSTTEPEETATIAITEVDATETEITGSVTSAAAGRKSQSTGKTTTKKKTPAEKIPASTEYKNFTAPDSGLSDNNGAFPSSDTIIKKAASLLGTPYGWGNKGYTGIYSLFVPNKALTVAQINNYGIDCSGLVFYTLTQLGYKSSGFLWCNPMPVDTVHWLSVNNGSTITYNGVKSKVDVEKKGLSTSRYEYWKRSDGSTITPGSIVVGENLYDDNHAWIYMGEFASRNDVIAYLKFIGVPSYLINSKTVGDGKGSGGTHWRIESNGSEGVVINNNTEKENTEATTYNIYVFRITPENKSFEINVYNPDGKSAGVSPVDKTSFVYGIYRDKACTLKMGEITIGSGGSGKITLPANTYYAKQLRSATGYASDNTVYTIKAGKNKITHNYLTQSIKVTMTSEDGIVSGSEFKLSWTSGGKTYTKTAKTNSSGNLEFTDLSVYDLTSGKAINYTVSMINPDTGKYITPADQSVTLTKGKATVSVARKCVPKPETPESGGDSSDSDSSSGSDQAEASEN